MTSSVFHVKTVPPPHTLLVMVVAGFFVAGFRVGRVVMVGRFVVIVVVGARCGGFFVGTVVMGRCWMVVGDVDAGRFVTVLFSTMSAKSWKLSFSDSTILFTSNPILSLSRSSSMNCGVDMS